MIICHPIDAPLLDAMFNHGADVIAIQDKRYELHLRNSRGESLAVLVDEAKAFAQKLVNDGR